MRKIRFVIFCVLMLGVVASAATENLGLWRMGETLSPPALVGANARAPQDSSGNELHFVNIMNQIYGGGPVTYSDDVPERLQGYSTRSYQFVHNGTWGGAADSADWPEDNMGIEAWIKTSGSSGGQTWGDVMVKMGGPDSFATYRIDGEYFARVNGVDFGHTPVPEMEWVHLALVRLNGVSTFYFNGEIAGTSSEIPPGLVGGHQFERDSGWVVWTGLVDEMHFFDIPDPNTFDVITDLQYNNVVAMASNPTPVNGATEVPTMQVLSWDTGHDPNDPLIIYSEIDGHGVYIGTDAAAVAAATPATAEIFKGYQPVAVTTYSPAASLDNDTTYYWRIDEKLGSDSRYVKGQLWSFDTVITKPIITQQPESIGLFSGADGVFTVEAYDPLGGSLSYQWYKDGVGALTDDSKYSGSETNELTVSNVDNADAGNFYCIVTSDSALSTESDWASLIAGALIGHWPFDGDPNDIVGINDGVYTGGGTETYAEGIVGSAQAIDFTDNTDMVEIPSANFTNQAWSLTCWDYSAPGGGGNGEWETILGNGGADGWDVFEFGRESIDRYVLGTTGGYVWTPDDESLPRGEWNFHAITHDPSTGVVRWYINGVQYTQISGVSFTAFDGPITVGNLPYGQPYSGKIDDLRMFDFPLPPSFVLDMYLAVKPLCAEYVVSDINEDCEVNVEDFVYLAVQWLECGRVPDCL